MLYQIGDESRIEEFIARAKDKDDPFRLMGFGHRVYKNYDPRATVIRDICDEVLEELGSENDPLLRIAKKLEKIALEDDYFIERKLFPNVVLLWHHSKGNWHPDEPVHSDFATGRTPGWIAHWHEMLSENYRIGRPVNSIRAILKETIPIPDSPLSPPSAIFRRNSPTSHTAVYRPRSRLQSPHSWCNLQNVLFAGIGFEVVQPMRLRSKKQAAKRTMNGILG